MPHPLCNKQEFHAMTEIPRLLGCPCIPLAELVLPSGTAAPLIGAVLAVKLAHPMKVASPEQAGTVSATGFVRGTLLRESRFPPRCTKALAGHMIG